MQNDADRMTQAGAHATHALTQIDAVAALRALDRAIVDREGDSVTLAKRHDFNAALHTRLLFGQREFATWIGKARSPWRS